jgi:hypothetical protein
MRGLNNKIPYSQVLRAHANKTFVQIALNYQFYKLWATSSKQKILNKIKFMLNEYSGSFDSCNIVGI